MWHSDQPDAKGDVFNAFVSGDVLAFWGGGEHVPSAAFVDLELMVVKGVRTGECRRCPPLCIALISVVLQCTEFSRLISSTSTLALA